MTIKHNPNSQVRWLYIFCPRSRSIVGFLFQSLWIFLLGTGAFDRWLCSQEIGQPLASNVQRLLEAVDFLGQPLINLPAESLLQLCRQEDAAGIQAIMDEYALAVVAINPESKVKVQRGKGCLSLQQSGHTVAVIKIINQGNIKSPLKIQSPQAGPSYSGSTRLSVERLDQPNLHQVDKPADGPRRFLHLEWYTQPPMTSGLSGISVEYGLLLIYTSDAGLREAVLEFSVGAGTQDLGFRAQLPVVFECQPAIPVQIQIDDDSDIDPFARLTIRDAQDRVYPAQIRRLAPDLFFQEQIYRASGELVWLPPGKFIVESSRGPEYHRHRQDFTVEHLTQLEQAQEKKDRAQKHKVQADQTDKSDQIATEAFPVQLPPSSPAIQRLHIPLRRWVNPKDYGWYSGDHHIHGAGCAHYQNPTEGVTPQDMFRQVCGEALNVGCVLTWGPCFEHQRQFFRPEIDQLSRQNTIMKYDLEISGFGSQALGHVCLLNLTDQTYPGSNGTKELGWPSWTTPVLRWAKQQGAVTGFAHSASGLQIDPDKAARRLMDQSDTNSDEMISVNEANRHLLPDTFQRIDSDKDSVISLIELRSAIDRAADRLPNLAIPEMNSVGAMELPVAVVEGVCDFISAMDTPRISEWNMWYHVLNSGFPLKVSGETDFPCMSGMSVGQGRSYVQLGDQPLSFPLWCQRLAEGRSYVSDGYAHALSCVVEVDQQRATLGEQIHLAKADRVNITTTVAFAPETPESIAYATRSSPGGQRLIGDTVTLHGPRSKAWIAGGPRTVELIVNGQVVAHQIVEADGVEHHLEFSVAIEKSSWLAIRCFPELHTNSIEILIDKQPIRASADSARWCAEAIRQLWRVRSNNISAHERPAAERAFQRAIQEYERRAQEANS